MVREPPSPAVRKAVSNLAIAYRQHCGPEEIDNAYWRLEVEKLLQRVRSVAARWPDRQLDLARELAQGGAADDPT
jgi:hypothetical protein